MHVAVDEKGNVLVSRYIIFADSLASSFPHAGDEFHYDCCTGAKGRACLNKENLSW